MSSVTSFLSPQQIGEKVESIVMLEMGSKTGREQVKMEIEGRTQDVGQAVHMQTTRFAVGKSWITVLRTLPLLSSSLPYLWA